MRAEDLPALDLYIDEHIGTMTTRHASEERFACPPIEEAVAGERLMRTTLHTMFDRQVSVDQSEIDLEGREDLEVLKESYWGQARHVTTAHGAKAGFELKDYFHVGQDRHYEAIKASALAEHGAGSLFDCLDAYQAELKLDSVSASRILTTLLDVSLPTIGRDAAIYRDEGCDTATASALALTDFATTTVPAHIANLQERANHGVNIKSLINKASLYPDPLEPSDGKALRVSRADAEGIAKVYRVQERPYNRVELEVAEELMQRPAMQTAILRFHLALVDYVRDYLRSHPDRAQHSLEPFSEIFVPVPDETGAVLVPPKLIKVIGNNTMPAVASVLMEAGGLVEDVTSNHIQEGIALAKKLRVFQTQIGQFNDYDPDTDTVKLQSLFPRTCPAMQMFSEEMTRRLPDLYDEASF